MMSVMLLYKFIGFFYAYRADLHHIFFSKSSTNSGHPITLKLSIILPALLIVQGLAFHPSTGLAQIAHEHIFEGLLIAL
jgi:hypothetical protein